MVCSDPLLWRSPYPPILLPEVKQPLSAGREERYRQNDLLPFISYQHHQSWIVVAILLPQALDCTLCEGKCRRFVRQKCAVGIVLFSSVRPPDGEKISRHCYLIETCPHAREASYTQSMKVMCRDCANACSEFLPRRQQCFGHCEPTRDLRPNHACEPFALENFATTDNRARYTKPQSVGSSAGSQRAVQIERSTDQGEMGESLREVSQGLAAMPGLFRKEADMVGKPSIRSKISLASSSRDLSWRPARVSASTSQNVQMLKVPSSPDSPSTASSILYRYTRLLAVRPCFASGSSVASNVVSMRGSAGDMKKVSAIIRLAASSDSLP